MKALALSLVLFFASVASAQTVLTPKDDQAKDIQIAWDAAQIALDHLNFLLLQAQQAQAELKTQRAALQAIAKIVKFNNGWGDDVFFDEDRKTFTQQAKPNPPPSNVPPHTLTPAAK